jgi:hypothetical protein
MTRTRSCLSSSAGESNGTASARRRLPSSWRDRQRVAAPRMPPAMPVGRGAGFLAGDARAVSFDRQGTCYNAFRHPRCKTCVALDLDVPPVGVMLAEHRVGRAQQGRFRPCPWRRFAVRTAGSRFEVTARSSGHGCLRDTSMILCSGGVVRTSRAIGSLLSAGCPTLGR